jgi:hypothetical protein
MPTMSAPVVPNVSLGAKSGDGLTPLNRRVNRGPFDPRAEGVTVDDVNDYLASVEGPAASSERLRVLQLESQQESPRVSIKGMREFLDDGSDVYDVPDPQDPEQEQGSEDTSEDGGGDADAGDSGEGQTSVDGSTVTES